MRINSFNFIDHQQSSSCLITHLVLACLMLSWCAVTSESPGEVIDSLSPSVFEWLFGFGFRANKTPVNVLHKKGAIIRSS